jgi:hypothetical protein
MKWTRTFDWPKLKHGYMWKIPLEIDDTKAFTIFMPGAQGQVNVNQQSKVNRQGEMVLDQMYNVGEATNVAIIIQPRVSYPRLHMSQPQIPDETGHMKFRYAIRMSAETHVLFHLLPDHTTRDLNAF